jgi:ubiquinone/menaquinone biosynthesis C-methylase UbiE
MLPDMMRGVLARLPRPALRAAYRAQMAGIRLPLLATQRVIRRVSPGAKAPPRQALEALEREYFRLLDREVANVERGAYPAHLAVVPVLDHARALPRFVLDLPRTLRRIARRAYRDLPADVELSRYPAYFRRTFHWQTDGYLSRSSAELYDLSVELVFLGCADVMRRQVIPPITAFARDRSAPLRILDVGCGTGRTLLQLARALPEQRYAGVDLSPFYLEHARRLLADVPELSLACENAEALPFRDGWFDVVTTTYLFHELPAKARRRAMAEMHRVLRPGGLFVLEDSAQLAEAADLAFFLSVFAKQMHEPFYRDYVKDDVAALIASTGLSVSSVERAWLSKVVVAERPA